MAFLKKLRDCSLAVFAIIFIVSLLMIFGIVEFRGDLFWKLIVGAIIFVVGQALFLMSAQTGIMQMGQKMGANVSKFKHGSVVYLVVLLLAFSLTMAEPDIQFFLQEVCNINPVLSSFILLLIFAVGVGIFSLVGLTKVLKSIKLKYILAVTYLIIFVFVIFLPNGYFGLAFDAGAVTTGPITVPVLLTIIAGISGLKTQKSREDSFGLIGIASFGPVFAILLVGLFTGQNGVPNIDVTSQSSSFFNILGDSALKALIAFLPICIFFIIINFSVLKLPKRELIRIFISVLFTFVALTLFLVGIYFGFAPMADFVAINLGNFVLNSTGGIWLIVLIMVILGFVLVFTEPAIGLLSAQINQITNGFVKKKVYLFLMGCGMAVALVLGILKVAFQINSLYILLPALVIVVILAFFIDEIFIGMAIDTGAVAVGSMMVAFVFPVICGIASTIDANIFEYAFGTLALVATIPILAIEFLGLAYKIKTKRREGNGKKLDNSEAKK